MMHCRDEALEGRITKSQALVQLVARYLARVSVFGMQQDSDTPPFDKHQPSLRMAAASVAKRPPKHAAVKMGDRFRCLWCLRTSASLEQIASSPCAHAGGHTLWRSDGITICSRCGAYIQFCTRLLGNRCTGVASAARRTGIARVFERNLHQIDDRGISNPVFWRKCVDQHFVEQKALLTPSDRNAPAFDSLAELFAIADRLIPSEACKNKGYARSKADHDKYAEAVLGDKGIVSETGGSYCSCGGGRRQPRRQALGAMDRLSDGPAQHTGARRSGGLNCSKRFSAKRQ